MAMNDDASSEPAASLVEVLEHALEGGLLRLAVGKPVQQAIGRLLYGAADVPAAYLEGWARNCSGGYATREDNPQEVARTARRRFAKSMSKASGSKSSSSIHSRGSFRSGLAGSARTSKSSAYPQLPPQSSGGQFRFPAVQMG